MIMKRYDVTRSLKKYVFEIEVEEGNDEFWEGYDGESAQYLPHLPSIEDVAQLIKEELENNIGISVEIKPLKKIEEYY